MPDLADSLGVWHYCCTEFIRSDVYFANYLIAVDLGVDCHEIANTDDTQEKNEVLVESLGGFFGGAIYGIGATAAVLFMATPVGWGAALVIGVGSALSGYGAGKIAKHFYTTTGTKVDLTSSLGVNRLCN